MGALAIALDKKKDAEKFCQVVWQRGLLKNKGLGLCHGISGNGYVFLRMYQAYDDEKYLNMARWFCRFGLDNYDKFFNFPNSPKSLYQGAIGFACFALDVRSGKG